MNYLAWLLKAATFFAVFAFALNNQDTVRVHFFFGHFWDAPLVTVVLGAAIMGLVAGVTVMLPRWLKARSLLAAHGAQPLRPSHENNTPHGT